jgi:hypothetical protein
MSGEPGAQAQSASPEALAEDFLRLEYEAHQNGNCNFCFFPESLAVFRAMAQRLHDALDPILKPEECEDDDEAMCLLDTMCCDSPHDLPISADQQYQALRRVLTRIGIVSEVAG